MQSIFPLGALVVLLSGSSALIPVLADAGLASTGPQSIAVSGSGASASEDLAIRAQEGAPPEEDSVLPTPGLPIAAPQQPRVIQVSMGQASWYGPGFYGNRTASGEVLRRGTLPAAHRTLPFGTRVRVTNLLNGNSAVVRINDRGPFHSSRVIDLAHGAATELGVASSGVARVRLEVLR